MTDKRAFSTKAPFGVATKRFEKIGFHPELDLSGAMKREITKAGPGSYNPKFYSCKSKSKVCSWKYKVELEEFSKYLGFRNANILAQRNFDKTLRGPGTNDTNEALFKKQSNAVLENIGFGSGARFRQGRKREQKPSPDTYFRHYTNKFITKKSFSKLPTFEYDGVEDRFKSRTPSYQLPPNLYNINDGKNTTDITKKVVSHLKGPYDLFSGSRSEDLSSETPDYFFINPSDVDVLLHSRWKKRCGLFLQCTRFPSRPTVRHMLNDVSLCYRDPNAPGPPHYNVPWGIKMVEEGLAPFDSSQVNARPPADWRIHPGPGRYSPKLPRCMKLKKASWVFLSKAPRTTPIKGYNEEYSLF